MLIKKKKEDNEGTEKCKAGKRLGEKEKRKKALTGPLTPEIKSI